MPDQERYDRTIDAIDGALRGDTSPDAMRWTPDPPEPTKQHPPCTLDGEPVPVDIPDLLQRTIPAAPHDALKVALTHWLRADQVTSITFGYDEHGPYIEWTEVCEPGRVRAPHGRWAVTISAHAHLDLPESRQTPHGPTSSSAHSTAPPTAASCTTKRYAACSTSPTSYGTSCSPTPTGS
jgi:hypothetical protein